MEKKKGVLIICSLTIIMFLTLLIAGCSSRSEQMQGFQTISGQMEGNATGVIFLPNKELCSEREKLAIDNMEACVRRQLAEALNGGYNVTTFNTIYKDGYLYRAEVYYKYY